ncbi:MAG: hypothetical protein IJ661_09295 [Lachnospiraceae bacterium]|nr:hypothetical protein [Lachnospiraceae bacterium]
MSTTIYTRYNAAYNAANNKITEQTKNRIVTANSQSAPHSKQNDKAYTVNISDAGLKSYKEGILKTSAAGLQHNDGKSGIIMTDYNYLFGSRMPSRYGEPDENGEYIPRYYSVKETADNMLNTYEGLYDEIVKGHEAGTRDIYIEDSSSEKGYRKLTMEEELNELDKAYQKYVDNYIEQKKNSIHGMEIIAAAQEKIAKIKSGKIDETDERLSALEKYKNDPVPDDFRQKMIDLARAFAINYI